MPDFVQLSVGVQRSRRNLIKVGIIATSAAFTGLITTRPATAQNNQGQDNNNQGQNNNGAKCFLKGTMIRTTDGDRKVEDLAIGDLLPTVFSGICPIQSIERYTLKKSDPTKTWNKDILPVRVARSA